MSDTQQSAPDARPIAPYTPGNPNDVPNRTQATAWVGMVLFGGIMMQLMGGFQLMQAFVAIFKEDYYLVTRDGLVVNIDYTAWGWSHLLIGLVAIATGICVILGQMWARVMGILIAVFSALMNIVFLAAYPVWSTIIIAIDVLVIYALAAHGREVTLP
jgi:hypothetical protein